MTELKLIDKNTDLSDIHKLDWDLNVKGKPYNVYRVEGYYHTIGGRFAENDYWCCPVDETPTYKNLIEFDGEPVRWGIESYSNNYTSSKWGETEVRHNYHIVITRNGEPFVSFGARDLSYGLATAQYKLANYQEHPINFTDRNFREKLEGRKIWYRNQKAIIERWVEGQACVIITFENGKYEEPEYLREEFKDEDANYVKEDVLSEHIWWFRV